jgi:COP9 signalosome complex subunit 2
MTDLVDAYQRREVHLAEKILRDNRSTIMDDPFIRSYIGDLLRSLRTQYLIDLIKPYTRLELSFLARVRSACPTTKTDFLFFLLAIKCRGQRS